MALAMDPQLRHFFEETAKWEANLGITFFDFSVLDTEFLSPTDDELNITPVILEDVTELNYSLDVCFPTTQWTPDSNDGFSTTTSTTESTSSVNDALDTSTPITDYTPIIHNSYNTPDPNESYCRHAGVQQIDRHAATSPPYFLGKGRFTAEEKLIIRDYCLDTPHEVMWELRKRIPGMTKTYTQVKGAIENERRKRNRRLDTGPWTDGELSLLAENLQFSAKRLTELLRERVVGCVKNIDQVRDMRLQLKKKEKAWVARQKKGVSPSNR